MRLKNIIDIDNLDVNYKQLLKLKLCTDKLQIKMEKNYMFLQ